MKFQPKILQHKIVGFEARAAGAHFFFGSRHASRDDLPLIFPDYEFHFLKQVHGRKIVAGDRTGAEADGHWTSEKNRALVIQTADCLPVLFSDGRKIVAVHAGWRGVARNIIGEAAISSGAAMIREASSHWWAAIGPHIAFRSFEVGNDVVSQILDGIASEDRAAMIRAHKDPDKSWVDLSLVARGQILRHWGDETRIVELDEDTYESDLFHSFRRDRENAQRQYSFVALTA